ncbi:MAG: PQQ-binding-like beta-propeller repeat protein [Planctomycetota bacterium]
MGKTFAPLLLAAFFLAGTAHAENWPNWRGPTFNQVAPDGDYPTTLDPTKNAVWNVVLPGKGSSTPCVWGELVFITCDIDGEDGILCYDLTGSEQWRKTLGKQRPGKHRNASGSNPTPITNGERVFVYYKSGTVAALDFNGEIAWQLNLQNKYGKDTLWWDLGTSPVLAGDNIVIAVMHEGESYLVALNQKSGEVAWRTLRNFKTKKESDQAYTTPIVTEIDGQQQIVTWGADHLTGHSLDGELIWTCGGFNPEDKAMWRVIASHGISNGYAVVPYGRADFVAFVKLGGKGDITETAHVGLAGPKVGSDVPSPIAVGGKAYVLTDAKGKTNGQVMCYDITNGKPIWDEPFALPRAAGSYYSSPVKAGNLFYFSHESGIIHVAKETETGMELVKTNEMPERQIATVVPINDHILLRSETTLYYFKKLDAAAALDH